MRDRPVFWSLIAIAVAGALLDFWREKPVQRDDEWVIGAAVAETGWLSAYDQPPLNGARFAIEDLNAAGGVLGHRLQILESDTHSEQTGSAVAAIELLDRGIALLLSSCDFDLGAPAAIEADRRSVVDFALCGADPLMGRQGVGPFAYNMSTISPVAGYVAAEWAYKNRGWRHPYVLLEDSSVYQRSLCRSFETRWRELTAASIPSIDYDLFTSRDSSIASQVTRISAVKKDIDFVYLCSVGQPGLSAIRQLRAAGIDTAIMTDGPFDGDWWRGSVPHLSNFFYTTWFSMYGNDESPRVNSFFARYRHVHGDIPNVPLTVFSYAAVEMWAEAVRRVGRLDQDAIRRELDSMREVETIAGKSSFTPDIHFGLLNRGMIVMEIEDWRRTSHGRQYPTVAVSTGMW